MKNSALVFITLIVGTFASPAYPSIFGNVRVDEVSRNERIVTGQIVEAIENIARQIREAGLDPMKYSGSANWELPVPVVFSAIAVVDQFEFTGLSNIVIERINFSLLQTRLTFSIVLPQLALSVGNAEADVVFFGENYSGSLSGSLNINQVRLIGDIRLNIGIISGITVRNLSLQFSLGGIQSNLNIKLFGKDLSGRINTYLGTTFPGKLNKFQRELNQVIETIALDLINNALQN